MPFYNKELIAPDTHSTIRIGEEVLNDFYDEANDVAKQLFGKETLPEAMDSLFYSDKDGNIKKFDAKQYQNPEHEIYELAVTNTLFVRDKDNILRQFRAEKSSIRGLEINISEPIKAGQIKEPVKPSFITYLFSPFVESFRAKIDSYNQMKKVTGALKAMTESNSFGFDFNPKTDPLANAESYSKKRREMEAEAVIRKEQLAAAKDLKDGPINIRNLDPNETKDALSTVAARTRKTNATIQNMFTPEGMKNPENTPEKFYETAAQILENKLAGSLLAKDKKMNAKENEKYFNDARNVFSINSAYARDYVKTIFDKELVENAFNKNNTDALKTLRTGISNLPFKLDDLTKFSLARTRELNKKGSPVMQERITTQKTTQKTTTMENKSKGKTMGGK